MSALPLSYRDIDGGSTDVFKLCPLFRRSLWVLLEVHGEQGSLNFVCLSICSCLGYVSFLICGFLILVDFKFVYCPPLSSPPFHFLLFRNFSYILDSFLLAPPKDCHQSPIAQCNTNQSNGIDQYLGICLAICFAIIVYVSMFLCVAPTTPFWISSFVVLFLSNSSRSSHYSMCFMLIVGEHGSSRSLQEYPKDHQRSSQRS